MSKREHIKEPVIQISRRMGMPAWKSWLIRLAAIALALVVNGLLIYFIADANPFKAYLSMIDGSFSTKGLCWAWIRDTMRLLVIAVALAPAFKMRFWNIGAEGQVLVGALATSACMIYLGSANIPTPLFLVIMGVASMVAGAVWGIIPAVFKARWGTNETLFTLMMNYIAIQLTSFFIPMWEHPKGSNTVGIINAGTKAGWFPELFGQQYFLNVLLVAVITVLMFFYLKKSKQGYEIAVVGQSENTARYAAMNVKRIVVRTMTLSGAICGLGGFLPGQVPHLRIVQQRFRFLLALHGVAVGPEGLHDGRELLLLPAQGRHGLAVSVHRRVGHGALHLPEPLFNLFQLVPHFPAPDSGGRRR